MKNLLKKMACFLLALLLSAGTAAAASANAAVKSIVEPDSWEVASAGVPVVRDFTLPSDSSDVYLLVRTNAPAAFTMMIFDGDDMEIDSIRIEESDPAWASDSAEIYANGYHNNLKAGEYHAAITFDIPTAFQFAVAADIREAVLSSSTLTITAGFTRTLSVKDQKGSVKWKSSKPSIASVDSKGKVTAKKAGKCTITASVDGKNLKCTVTVKNNKYSAIRLTNSDIPNGKASWEAYSASYDEQGNLTIKFRIVNNCGHYSEYLKNLSVKVKTAKGSTAVSYKESKKDLYVADQSYKDFKITIPKSSLKIKKEIDLRSASIITDGSYGYTYYTYH